MIKVVHACNADLVKVNMQAEISSVNIVNDLEEILPTEPKQRWYRLSRDVSDKEELFPKLLPFLLEEKKNLERLCNASKQVDSPVFNVLSDVESPVAGIIAAIDKLSTKISEIVEKSYDTQNYNFSQDGGF